MYGEGDPFQVTSGLRDAMNNAGILTRIGSGITKLQYAYVGNVAWAHIAAMKVLRKSQEVGGQAYFITDDTPPTNPFTFMQPYLVARGFRLSNYYIPYQPVYGVVFMVEKLLWLLAPLVKISLPVPAASILYVNSNITFSREKAELSLNYTPLYCYRESMKKAMAYYKTVKL